jgi:hypothetical protein
MRQFFIFGLVCAIGLSFSGCGKKEEKSNKPTVASTASTSAPSAVDEKKLPNPYQFDPAKPIPVQELHTAYFGWKNKTISVVGYPDTFFDTEDFNNKTLKLTGGAGDKKVLFSCEFPQNYSAKLAKAKTITIKGKFDQVFLGQYVVLTECSVLANDEAMPDVKSITAFNISDNKVGATALSEGIRAWDGKDVSVAGFYVGTTTSTTKSGKTIRVDLLPENKGLANSKVLVSCNMKTDETDAFKAAQAAQKPVVVKGKIIEPYSNKVVLENVELIKN